MNNNINVIDVRIREDEQAKMISFEFNDDRQIKNSGYVAFIFSDNSIEIDRYEDGDLIDSYSDELLTDEEKQQFLQFECR